MLHHHIKLRSQAQPDKNQVAEETLALTPFVGSLPPTFGHGLEVTVNQNTSWPKPVVRPIQLRCHRYQLRQQDVFVRVRAFLAKPAVTQTSKSTLSHGIKQAESQKHNRNLTTSVISCPRFSHTCKASHTQSKTQTHTHTPT